MASGKFLFFLCLMLILPAGQALAEYTGFFLLGDLQHGVALDYLYSGQRSKPKNGKTTTSSQNRFSETYNAGIEYSILDPYILNGNLKVSLGMDQERYSGSIYDEKSTSGNKYSYDLNGVFLKITPTPVNFAVSSETRHVEAPFTPGYDLTFDSHAVGVSLRHKILDLRLDYQDSRSETDGSTNDTKLSNSLLLLKGNHDYRNSSTELRILRNTSDLEPVHGSAISPIHDVKYTIVGNNVLTSTQNDKTLNSNVTYSEEKQTQSSGTVNSAQGESIINTLTFGESFIWQMGKALTFGASYENSSVTTSGSGAAINLATDSRQQIGTVSLNHNLYKSLNTRLKFQGRENDLSTGRETEYTGSASFNYTKKIAPADSLTLNYMEEYSVTDRNLSSRVLTIIDEPLTAQLTGSNLLQQPNVVNYSIIVRDRINPLTVYVVNVDYQLTQAGAFTGFDFSVIGSSITNGQQLLVSYQYSVDENVKYRRSTHTGGGAITFDAGVYQLYANITQSSQEVLSGQADLMRTDSSLYYLLGATRTKDGHYANIVYVCTDSDQISTRYVEATYRLTRYFDMSSLNAQVKDRYTWYGSTTYNSRDYTENQFSLSGDYSTNIFSNGLLTLRAIYYRYDTDNRERNDLALESSYRWGFGKFYLEATGRVQYRDTNGDEAMDERLYLRVTRAF